MRSQKKKRSSRVLKEGNEDEEEMAVDAQDAEELEREPSEQPTTPSGRKSAAAMRRLKNRIVEIIQEDITWPTESHTPALRNSMKLVFSLTDAIKAHIDEAAALLCVFCSKVADDDEELIHCQGLVNQILRKTECKSKFHLKCALNYNHGAYLFQYAARPECQNKLLCPLHCCTACNFNQRKQTAYEGKLIECAQCLRSFHTDTCLPVGSTQILVELQTDERQVQVPMIICPFHAKPVRKTNSKHVRVCINCTDPSQVGLTKCKYCVRMYHKTCRQVTMINGKPALTNVCDHCLGNHVTRFNVPMLAKWKTAGFFLCIPRPWDLSPILNTSAHFKELGYTAVEWIVEEKKWSIMHLTDICQLSKTHLAIDPPESKRYWELALEAFNESARFPPRYKEAHRMGKASKHFDKSAIKLFQFHENGICHCEGEDRCTTDDCIYVASGCECPPECSQNGRICKNRNVSEQKQHPNMELRKAGVKGFGVFAKGPIKKGEYLAEYVGELINKSEKDKRLLAVHISKDQEANHYMMDISGGMTVDAARYGNVTRYMNHSCEPNAGSYHVKIFIKNDPDAEHSWFDYRAIIKAMRDIEKDEEITFDYGMKQNDAVPDCKCGSVGCTGRLTKKKDREEEEEDDEENEEPVKTIAGPKRGRSRNPPQATPKPASEVRKRGRRSNAELEMEGYPPRKKRVSRPDPPEFGYPYSTRSQGLSSNPEIPAPEDGSASAVVRNENPVASGSQGAPAVPPNIPASRGRARYRNPPIPAPEDTNAMPLLIPNHPMTGSSSQELQMPHLAPESLPSSAVIHRTRSVAAITHQRAPKFSDTPVARAPRTLVVRSVAPEPAHQEA